MCIRCWRSKRQRENAQQENEEIISELEYQALLNKHSPGLVKNQRNHRQSKRKCLEACAPGSIHVEGIALLLMEHTCIGQLEVKLNEFRAMQKKAQTLLLVLVSKHMYTSRIRAHVMITSEIVGNGFPCGVCYDTV